MDKSITQEERIKRAEEIYKRRKKEKSGEVRVASSSVNNGKTKLTLFKKITLQLAICSVIYIIFYLIKNTNYIFSEDVIQKTKELLSYDINFDTVYSSISTFIEENKDKFNFLDKIVNANEETEEENAETTNQEEEENETTGGVGGAEADEEKEETEEEKTQMEIDAKYIKENYSMIVPVSGTVTSTYGEREATEIVSSYHYGIDIGADTGTAIYAAMEGTVTLSSSEGDYRKTY